MTKTRTTTSQTKFSTTSMTMSTKYTTDLSDLSSSSSFTLLTYNIDNLNPTLLHKRLLKVIELIQKSNADVVHLQEVIDSTEPLLINGLKHIYTVADTPSRTIRVGGCHYYTLTFVQKKHRILEAKRIDFVGGAKSNMGRDALHCRVQFQNTKNSNNHDEANQGASIVTFINSHLESMKESSSVRTHQLTQLFRAMSSSSDNQPMILAGDLNMRNKEVSEALQTLNLMPTIPKKRKKRIGSDNVEEEKGVILDAYEFFQKPKNAASTWEMTDYTTPPRFLAKSRFDRVYHNSRNGLAFLPFSDKSNNANAIQMIGRNKSVEIGNGDICRPSDHFGMIVRFKFPDVDTQEARVQEQRQDGEGRNNANYIKMKENSSPQVVSLLEEEEDREEVAENDPDILRHKKRLKILEAVKRRTKMSSCNTLSDRISTSHSDIIDLT